MKKVFNCIGYLSLLAGIAGVIGHSVSFGSQTSTMVNTFSSTWFAGIFAISGLNLIHLLQKNQFSRKVFWFEIILLIWICCSSFISLVCAGYIHDWSSFAWVFVTFLPALSSLMYIVNINKFLDRKIASVSTENQETRSLTAKLMTGALYFLKILFLLILSFLAAGSIVAAVAASYAAPGQAISVLFDGANRNGTLQVLCIGSRNNLLPAIFIFASAAHGIVDMYGLQYFLTSVGNRRVCIHDPPGFGWSQDPFVGQFTNYEYLYRLMLSTGEPAPWHLVGWGGGGSAIMDLATNHSSSVKSVTFIETYPPGIEFAYYGYKKSLDQQAIQDYRASDLASRIGLVYLILSIAIPWGLIGIFVPISPQDTFYFPPEKWSEFRVQMWKSKTWIAQYLGIQKMQSTPDANDPLIAFAPLSSQVNVFGVYCNVTSTCFDGFKNRTGQDCTDLISQTSYYNEQKKSMIEAISPNATVIWNEDYDCSQSLPVRKANWTATSLLALYSKIDV